MVLGVILYEGVDVMVHYDMEYPEVEREKHLLEDMDKIVARLEKLEGRPQKEKKS